MVRRRFKLRQKAERQCDVVLADEPNPLARDLQQLAYLARYSPDPRVREVTARLVSIIKSLQRSEAICAKVAEELQLSRICQQFSDEEIAVLIALPDHGKESPLRQMLRENLVDPRLERLEKSPGWDYEEFLTRCFLIFHHAFRREYLSRRQKNESPDGRAVREILVEERKRGELVSRLGKKKTAGLFFPGERRWRSEDAPAEANLGILERISEYIRSTPVAADPNALCAFMKGGLNRIPQHSVDHVRNLIETENRRLTRAQKTTDGDGSESQESPSSQAEPRRVLVELEKIADKSRVGDEHNEMLIEQLLSMPGLKPTDQQLVRLRLEGRTQEEVAALLGITQGQVSKKLRIIRTALKKAVQSPTQLET